MASTMKPPEHAPDFLAACGWAGAEILPLAGDASFRRYFRVVEGERTAVLMDAPPPHEDPRPFVAVAEWLASVGLSAPQILARDLDKGLLLLGDFGDWRLREFLDSDPQRERELYELATDVLIHLHRHKPMPGLMSHGLQQWLTELELFTEWYCPAVGADVDLAGYRSAWLKVLEPVAKDGLGPVTVLRDYHAENIMLVNDRQGVEHFGLLDFQDALAAQRNTRILGVFTRLWKRDDKPHYRRFQPRMWGLLERDLAQTGLEPVREWFDNNIAPEHRREPWKQAA